MGMASRKARINIEGEQEPKELAKKAKGTGILPAIKNR